MGASAQDVTAPDLAVLRGGRSLDILDHGGTAVAIAWPGMGSRFRSMHRIDLEPGGRTVALSHPGEAVYFVAQGAGEVAGSPFKAHDMVYVPAGVAYAFSANDAATIFGGPCPPDQALYEGRPAAATDDGDGSVRIFDADREGEPLPMIGKQVRLVVWPGVGAEVATMNFAILEPGEENQPHAHAESDDTIAILDGRGSIDDLTNGITTEFEAGDVVFVRAGITHKVKADQGVGIVSAGGPCPPDFGMLRALGLV